MQSLEVWLQKNFYKLPTKMNEKRAAIMIMRDSARPLTCLYGDITRLFRCFFFLNNYYTL